MKQTDSPRTPPAHAGNGKSRAPRGDVDARMLDRIRAAAAIVRIRQEALYDRLAERFHAHLDAGGDHGREAREAAAEMAREQLTASGVLSPPLGERLKAFLLRDHDPAARHRRTGEITSAGTLSCVQCGAAMPFARTATIPPCPRCATTEFAKTP